MSLQPKRLPTTRLLTRPTVIPYHASTTSAEVIEKRLLALRSFDSNTRIEAFNGLRAVPKALLREAWARVRWTPAPDGFDNECLHRLHVERPAAPLEGKRAFVTVISEGYESYLRNLLDSLALRGNCADVPVIVFCVGDETYHALESWPGVTRILCRPHGRVSAAVKGVIYSCTRWLNFETIVALEADMLVADDLNPLFESVEQGHKRNLYGCRSQGVEFMHRLREVLGHMDAPVSDLKFLSGKSNLDPIFHFNGGLLVGSWSAWKALDAGFEALNPFAAMWVEGAFHLTFTDEFVMNLVLSLFPQTLGTSELSPGWNTQIIDANVAAWIQEVPSLSGSRLTRFGEKVRLVHFIEGKALQQQMLARLKPLARTRIKAPMNPPPPMPARPPSLAARSAYTKCRSCPVRRTCGNCFKSGTFAVERLRSGDRSAICRLCFAESEGKSWEEIVDELKELAFELKEERRRNTASSAH